MICHTLNRNYILSFASLGSGVRHLPSASWIKLSLSISCNSGNISPLRSDCVAMPKSGKMSWYYCACFRNLSFIHSMASLSLVTIKENCTKFGDLFFSHHIKPLVQLWNTYHLFQQNAALNLHENLLHLLEPAAFH